MTARPPGTPSLTSNGRGGPNVGFDEATQMSRNHKDEEGLVIPSKSGKEL